MTRVREWYEDHDEVVALARWLEQRCEFNTPDDVIYYFSKPWKWTVEHDDMLQEQAEEVVPDAA